jgi:hypothetical protein
VVNQRVESGDLVVHRARPDAHPAHRLDGALGQLSGANHVRGASPVRRLGHSSFPGEVPERRHWVFGVVRGPSVRSQALHTSSQAPGSVDGSRSHRWG